MTGEEQKLLTYATHLQTRGDIEIRESRWAVRFLVSCNPSLMWVHFPREILLGFGQSVLNVLGDRAFDAFIVRLY